MDQVRPGEHIVLVLSSSSSSSSSFLFVFFPLLLQGDIAISAKSRGLATNANSVDVGQGAKVRWLAPLNARSPV